MFSKNKKDWKKEKKKDSNDSLNGKGRLQEETVRAIVAVAFFVLGVFFIIGYLNALDMREYLPALYYFNTRRALLYTVCVLLAAAGLVALM